MTGNHRETENNIQKNEGDASRKAVKQTVSKQSPTKKVLLTKIALIGIILTGFILRTSYLREIVHNPDFSLPQIDAGYNDYWARALVTGNWTVPENFSDFVNPEIRDTPYFRSPGYPFFLALIYYLSNGSYLIARIVQMSLGLVNCLLAYFLGKNIFGRSVGLLFAFFMSVYWIFIYFEGELLAPVLLITLSLSLIYILNLWSDEFSFRLSFAGGILLGLFALVRANILLFGPAVLCWSGWIAHRRKNNTHIKTAWPGFILGAVIIIAPVTIRNYIVAKDFILIASNAGINFYIGNNEDSTGTYSVIPNLQELGLGEEWTSFDYLKIARGVELLNGRKMKHSEISSYFTKKSIDYIRTHPWRFLKLLAIKSALFWGPAEVSNNKVLSCEKVNSATLRYMPRFPVVLSLAVIGLIQLFLGRKKHTVQNNATLSVTQRQFEISILILLFIFTYFISFLPFFIAGRYRVPAIPFLLLFGAFGLHRIGQLLVSHKLYTAICWFVILTGLFIAARIRLAPYEPDPAQWHLLRASCYRLAKQPDLAIKECHESIRLRPDLGKGHRRLADMLMHRRDYARAIKHYMKALQLKPGQYEVHYNLGLALSSQGELNDAISHFRDALKIRPDIPEIHYTLGRALKSKGKTDVAIEHFRQALKLRPDYIQARNNLATTLLAQHKFDEAISHLRWILKNNPNIASVHNCLGVALKSKGEIEQAMSHYRKAIKLKPDYYLAHNNLANAFVAQGQVDKAISHYRQALKIKPNYDEAQRNLNNALRLKEQH
jgi:tetratricopeptide (TPR) repeat protein